MKFIENHIEVLEKYLDVYNSKHTANVFAGLSLLKLRLCTEKHKGERGEITLVDQGSTSQSHKAPC